MSIDPAGSDKRVAHASPLRRWLVRALLGGLVIGALCLGGAASLSRPFQNGSTRLFGKVVDAVKDHPRGTAVLCLGGVAALWVCIGAIAAGQEIRIRRRRSSATPAPSKANSC
jgi:hypothetical protein